jgi:hypothetical protein
MKTEAMADTGHDTLMTQVVHKYSKKAPFPQGRNISVI